MTKRHRVLEEPKKNGSPKRTKRSTIEAAAPPKKFPATYICAPMVGASELAFRLLCRNYGCDWAYTPMMSAKAFATEPLADGFQTQSTCDAARTLVHVWANDPDDFARAAQVAHERYHCAGIDLNLGCPQRTAYVGQFGSYLLDRTDHPSLICQMIKAAAAVVPETFYICVKIRLLSTREMTLAFVQKLQQAGAQVVAIHARPRASWERQGPGARDGPADLQQVAWIQQQLMLQQKNTKRAIQLITNGNTITWSDVQDNLKLTQVAGLMSAEGLLDNPALFLPALAAAKDADMSNRVPVVVPPDEAHRRKRRKLETKWNAILELEDKLRKNPSIRLTPKEQQRLDSKSKIQIKRQKKHTLECHWSTRTLQELHDRAANKVVLAREYLDFCDVHPVVLRSILFHIRRMLKELLVQYQLMEELMQCTHATEIRKLLDKVEQYQKDPQSFVYDQEKAKAEKQAAALRKEQEGKRKAYEARMLRKAKREGKDPMHYLNIGAQVPTKVTVNKLRQMDDRTAAMKLWKESHSQHCFLFHVQECPRGRTCAFLHMECGTDRFQEKDEVAG